MKETGLIILSFVFCTLKLSAQPTQDPIPSDTVLCEKYGDFIPNEKRVFHSLMFDSLAAVKLSGLENPEIQDLLIKDIITSPDVQLPLCKYKDAFQAMLDDTAKQSYKSLNFGELVRIYRSNLIVKAEVVMMNELHEEHRFFKSTYLLRIIEIYKSDWPNIRTGDTIVFKSEGGYGYSGPIKTFQHTVISIGYESYEKGAIQIFGLTNVNYHSVTHGSFKYTNWALQDYKDYPCSGFFRAGPGDNRFYNDFNKTEDLKEYISLFLKE